MCAAMFRPQKRHPTASLFPGSGIRKPVPPKSGKEPSSGAGKICRKEDKNRGKVENKACFSAGSGIGGTAAEPNPTHPHGRFSTDTSDGERCLSAAELYPALLHSRFPPAGGGVGGTAASRIHTAIQSIFRRYQRWRTLPLHCQTVPGAATQPVFSRRRRCLRAAQKKPTERVGWLYHCGSDGIWAVSGGSSPDRYRKMGSIPSPVVLSTQNTVRQPASRSQRSARAGLPSGA